MVPSPTSRAVPGSRRTRRPAAAVALAAGALALSSCVVVPEPQAPTAPAPTPTGSSAPVDPPPSQPRSPEPTTGPTGPTSGPDQDGSAAGFPAPPPLPPVGDRPQDVATDLSAPWGIAFLPGGSALVTLRDTAEVVLIDAEGTTALTGPGADELAATTRTEGEGGLLGIAVSPDVAEDGRVYLYRTTAAGNEVVRASLDRDDDGGLGLGRLEPVLTGIPAASNHDGGRIAFGPDGHLYVATGDASDRGAAQDPGSLAGKILRLTADGDPAPGNPVADSPVWSLGHRNVQGLAWDADGRMFASELGQNAFDELNLVEPGGNYGWPDVEGTGGLNGLTDPLLVWEPAEASPSGIAVTDGAVHVASLRGQRLWTVEVDGAEVGRARSSVDLGRLRDVVVGPDGALWVLTNNTDGRGSPRPGDDRVVRLRVP